ncbi:MAG: YaiI/YqxD family protein [Desulfobulbaceae bacterium]
MQIWVDGDACPNAVKENLYRAAERVKVPLILVANAALRPPPSKYISTIRVAAGLNVADSEIARRCAKGDLVITADIPLAADVVAKGAFALNPRGELYTEATIRERLSMRNFMDNLRSNGIDTGGPPALSQKDRQAFANNLDRFLTQWLNICRSPDE